jgi:hypothetical protein
MIPEPFIQPRFVGARFEEHTLPISAAKDLAAYEELVLELAKHLFRERYKARRLPKGFANDFSLHISEIDPGSAKPKLVAMMIGAQLSLSLPAEITEAKELINAVISTAVGTPLPPRFPKDFYSYFNRIGRSLKDGEKIEWTPDLEEKTTLTPDGRIRLARAYRETYQAEMTFVGLVEELDAKRKSGVLRSAKNEAITFFYSKPFFADLKAALGDSRISARVIGVGVFDMSENLCEISEIDQLECLPHFEVISKIEALADLNDGWLEGVGAAPTADHLNQLSDSVVKYFPDTLEYPSVAPTQEGNVVFEWIRPHSRIELEINFANKKLEIYATNVTKREFVEDVFSETQWSKAFAKVEELLTS